MIYRNSTFSFFQARYEVAELQRAIFWVDYVRYGSIAVVADVAHSHASITHRARPGDMNVKPKASYRFFSTALS